MSMKDCFKRLARLAGYEIVKTDTLGRLAQAAVPHQRIPDLQPASPPAWEPAPEAAQVQPQELLADDGTEYRLVVRDNEPTTVVPAVTLQVLLRESLLLRRKACEVAELREALAARKAAPATETPGGPTGEFGPFYVPVHDFDGLRNDPRIIHNYDFMKDTPGKLT